MDARRSSRRCARALGVRAFFFLAALSGHAFADARLAQDLFEAGDWVGCRREAKRAALSQPEDPDLRFLEAVSRLRLRMDEEAARAMLREVIADYGKQGTGDRAAAAALELGASEEIAGRRQPALDAYSIALTSAGTPERALRAVAGIDRIREQDPEGVHLAPDLEPILRILRPSIPAEAKVAPAGTGSEARSGFQPAGFLVSLYRNQVRPAIGSRCELNPSCSEYFVQAGHRHGWLAFPMIADRFFREPSVVQSADRESARDSQARVADPLTDHDFWHRKESPP